jgi:hypothetical protein
MEEASSSSQRSGGGGGGGSIERSSPDRSAPPPRWRQRLAGVTARELEIEPGTSFVPDGPALAWLVRAVRRRSPSPALLDPDLSPGGEDCGTATDGASNTAAPCLAADTTYLDADLRIVRYTAAATIAGEPGKPRQAPKPLTTTSWEGVRDIFIRHHLPPH